MRSQSSISSSLDSLRSSSKCITDSRLSVSRACSTAVMRPASSRSAPITGWIFSRTVRPCASNSAETESTRNGESGVFVSSTEPGSE